MNFEYYLILIFCIFLWLIYTDASIAYAIISSFKILRFQYEKTKWWLWYNPQMPWAKYLMWRRSLRMAKELEKKLNK
jgi:hypothetical protein